MTTIQTNFGSLQRLFAEIVRSQIPFAQTGMVNSLAFKVREEIKDQIRTELEQPVKPYTQNMMRVKKSPTSHHPASFVFVSDYRKEDETLGHLFSGGYRNWKGMEKMLMRIGILKKGYYAIPGDGAPKDRYGNIRPSFAQMILSYFEAWNKTGESGTRNMTKESRDKKAKEGRTKAGYKTIRGVRYFVSFGKLSQWDASDLKDKTGLKIRPQPLAYGIWSKTGIHGFQVKPVLLFLPRRRGYKRYFNLFATGQKVRDEFAQQYFANYLQKGIATSRHMQEFQKALKNG